MGQSTTVFSIDKPSSMAVTSIGIDIDGNVWTGHIKGLLRVRRKQQWDFIAEEQLFEYAVKTIAFDDQQRAWVGDEFGVIKVIKFNEDALSPKTMVARQASKLFNRQQLREEGSETYIEVVAILTVPQRVDSLTQQPSSLNPLRDSQCVGGGLFKLWSIGSSSDMNAGALNNKKSGIKGGVSSSLPPQDPLGPIHCIFSDGPHSWVAGGRSPGLHSSRSGAHIGPWIALYSTTLLESLDRWECGAFGACHSMRPLGWKSHGNNNNNTSPSQALLTASTMPAPDPAAIAREGRKTRRRSYIEGGPPAMDWRLLTGHESGQLVMWHPASTRLSPLMYFGEPCSPIRGIMVFEGIDIICTGHLNGEVQMFVRPQGVFGGNASNLPVSGNVVPGSESSHPSSFACFK